MFYMTFVKWLDIELEKKNWNRADLSRHAGISQSALSHLYAERRKIGTDLCNAIAKALKLSPEMVYRQAGLLPKRH